MSLHRNWAFPHNTRLFEYSLEQFSRGGGIHLFSGSNDRGLNQAAYFAQTWHFDRLKPTSFGSFMSSVEQLACERIAVPADALGRCTLTGLMAIRRHLRARGVCWIYHFDGGAHAPLNFDEAPPGSRENRFQWLFCLRQAERCGFKLVFTHSASPSPPSVSSSRKGRGRGSVSVAIIRPQEPDEQRTRLMLGTIAKHHAVEVGQLFQFVFPAADMSSAHWEWKYSKGRGVAIGAWRLDQLVAHYGGVWRDVAMDGETHRAVQITDVMVSPNERGVMGKFGAFSLVAPTFAECFVGHGATALIGFGFPNERHFRAAEKRGLYGEVDRIVEIRWASSALLARKERLPLKVQPACSDQIRRQKKKLNKLWAQMRSGLPESIVGIRDYDYFLHRYINNPIHKYDYLIFRSAIAGRWLGAAVIVVSEKCVEVRDIIAHPRQFTRCIRALLAIARGNDRELRLWITQSHRQHFSVDGGVEAATGIVVPNSTWTNSLSVDEVRGRWFLMSGDTDFL